MSKRQKARQQRENKQRKKKEESEEEEDFENEGNSEDPQSEENEDGSQEEDNVKRKPKAGGAKSPEPPQEVSGPVPLTKAEIRRLKKDRKAGKITREEMDQRLGVGTNVGPSEEEQRRVLKAAEYADALQGYKVKKGEIDTKSKDIKVEAFTLAYKSNVLLRDTDLIITNGRKYGLIGPNGMGKSTLLRHISQRHLPIPKHINILHVEQEIEGTDTIAVDAVLEADTERTALLEEEKRLKPIAQDNTEEGMEAAERLIDVYKRLKAIGAYSAEARASAILAGLQFTPEMQKKRTKEFSGGWRMRVALARALFVMPDLLLLDEPTNHLDLDAVIWLEAYLKRYKKTLLLVSHDRDFLNGIVDNIINIRDQKLEYYKGNYDSFEAGLRQAKLKLQKEKKKQDKELDKIQKTQTKHARDQKKKIEKKGIIKKLEKDYTVSFVFRDPGKLTFPVIQIKNASFGYKEGPENLIFDGLELNVDCDSRIAIVGPNGTGKSTLMNLILGELKPTKGEIIRNRHLRVAKFSQHFVDQLTMTDTAVQYINKKFPQMKEQEVRNKLGMYNLKGQVHNQPISLLSGGQKSRVALCELALTTPHILFLDEPTNHLDIQSVDALSKALQEFGGGIVLISHDQRLVSTVAKELWVCRGDKKVEIYDGEFADYKQEIIDQMPDELFISEDED